MSQDIETLRMWIRFLTVFTMVAVTSFPVVYAFTPWRSRPLGRILMFLGISYAFAFNITTLFSFWRPKNLLWMFGLYTVMLLFIAFASILLTGWVWKLNRPFFRRRKGE